MEIRSFSWDEDVIDHIAHHGVDPDEVEEVAVAKVITARPMDEKERKLYLRRGK